MSTRTLLVVDDEPEIGAFIKRAAETAGFEVMVTSNMANFRDSFEHQPPDIVVLDLAMPGGDGIELLRYLMEMACEAEIVLISGFDRRVLETACRLGESLGLNMAGAIEKPVRLADLRKFLTSI